MHALARRLRGPRVLLLDAWEAIARLALLRTDAAVLLEARLDACPSAPKQARKLARRAPAIELCKQTLIFVRRPRLAYIARCSRPLPGGRGG